MKEEMVKKIEKWQEPPPAKTAKVLPVPDAEVRKKRGGKRYRKMKVGAPQASKTQVWHLLCCVYLQAPASMQWCLLSHPYHPVLCFLSCPAGAVWHDGPAQAGQPHDVQPG
jgi:hypothetical protein